MSETEHRADPAGAVATMPQPAPPPADARAERIEASMATLRADLGAGVSDLRDRVSELEAAARAPTDPVADRGADIDGLMKTVNDLVRFGAMMWPHHAASITPPPGAPAPAPMGGVQQLPPDVAAALAAQATDPVTRARMADAVALIQGLLRQ